MNLSVAFIVYLVTLFDCIKSNKRITVDYEMVIIRKDTVVAYFKLILEHLPERTDENYQTPG
jgi:hypothetical protein